MGSMGITPCQWVKLFAARDYPDRMCHAFAAATLKDINAHVQGTCNTRANWVSYNAVFFGKPDDSSDDLEEWTQRWLIGEQLLHAEGALNLSECYPELAGKNAAADVEDHDLMAVVGEGAGKSQADFNVQVDEGGTMQIPEKEEVDVEQRTGKPRRVSLCPQS